MKGKDFHHLVDHIFIPPERTGKQRMNTLRLVHQPERNIMKKKPIAVVAMAFKVAAGAIPVTPAIR